MNAQCPSDGKSYHSCAITHVLKQGPLPWHVNTAVRVSLSDTSLAWLSSQSGLVQLSYDCCAAYMNDRSAAQHLVLQPPSWLVLQLDGCYNAVVWCRRMCRLS